MSHASSPTVHDIPFDVKTNSAHVDAVLDTAICAQGNVSVSSFRINVQRLLLVFPP